MAYIIDFAFIFDIVLMFFTSVIDNRGKESFDSKLIAHRVTTSLSVYPDILSVLGTDLVAQMVGTGSLLKNFALMKMLRLFRIGTIISTLNINKITKTMLHLAKLVFYLGFYLWAMGCGLWYIISLDAP